MNEFIKIIFQSLSQRAVKYVTVLAFLIVLIVTTVKADDWLRNRIDTRIEEIVSTQLSNIVHMVERLEKVTSRLEFLHLRGAD